VIIDSKPA